MRIKDLWLPILTILIIIVVLAFPALMGKQIFMPDLVNYLAQIRQPMEWHKETGEEIVWAWHMFSGMPAYFVGSVISKVVVLPIYLINTLFTFMNPVGLFTIAFLLMVLFIRGLRVGGWELATISAIAFAIATFNIISLEAGHMTKLRSIYAFPLLFLGLLLLIKGNKWSGALTFLIGLTAELAGNHQQVWYYAFIMGLILGIVAVIDALKKRMTNNIVKAGVIGILLTIVAILPFTMRFWMLYEYTPHSIRGMASELIDPQHKKNTGLEKDYASNWSYGLFETFTLFVPNLMGGGSNQYVGTSGPLYKELIKNGVPQIQVEQIVQHVPTYWGSMPFTDGPVYIGILIMLGAILSFFIAQRNFIFWWLVISTIVGLMFAWGKNFFFWELAFDYLPGFNKFRTPMMAFLILQFTLPVLAVMGFSSLANKEIDLKKRFQALKKATLITGGVIVALILASVFILDFKGPVDAQLKNNPFFYELIIKQREYMLRMDAIRNLIIVIIGAGALWYALKGKTSLSTAFKILVALTLLDLLGVATRYLKHSDYVEKYTYENLPMIDPRFRLTEADRTIMQDTTHYFRVVDLTTNPFTDARTPYYYNSVGGYLAARIRIYQDLIDNHLAKNNIKAYSMLNTRWFIVPMQGQGPPRAMFNPLATGPVWFVDEILWQRDAKSENEALLTFEPKKQVLIREQYKNLVKPVPENRDTNARIKLLQFSPMKLVYEYDSETDQFAVFSEIYYEPGWKSYLDGKPVQYVRVNYVLRGMSVPAGKHTIEFRFEPDSYVIGRKISLAGSILWFIVAFGLALITYKAKRQN
ncbi:MAG: YfhO family protein [Chlorobi bacterium]|nr:YfhO family protein [Chlorobiota bacterium]